MKNLTFLLAVFFLNQAFGGICPTFTGQYKCDTSMETSMETNKGTTGETIYNIQETEIIADGNQHTSVEDGLTIDYSAYCADDKVKISSVIILGKQGYIQSSQGTIQKIDEKFVHEANTKVFSADGKLVGELPQHMTCELIK